MTDNFLALIQWFGSDDWVSWAFNFGLGCFLILGLIAAGLILLELRHAVAEWLMAMGEVAIAKVTTSRENRGRK